MVWVVGLTGGIGSGKSAAATTFASLGAAVIDTDVVARELTVAGGAATGPLRAAFGPSILTPDGALDRAAMRRLVFADADCRLRLESILHPLIRSACEENLRRIASADLPPAYAVLVVPLLVETGGYRERVKRVCVVDCPEELQIARTMARSGLSRQEVLAILAAQADRKARLAAADDIIDNAGGLPELQFQVTALHERYRDMAEKA